MSRGEVVKSGYLTKSPPEGRVGQWHRRWFVFADSHRVYPLAERYARMEYYQNEEDVKKLRNPKGRINLQHCTKVMNRENMRGFKHVFDVCTSERTYHLVADSSQDKHDWMDTLNTTLFTSSHSHKHTSHSPSQHTPHNRSSHPHTPNPSQQHQNVRSRDIQPPDGRSPDSRVHVKAVQAVQRPQSCAGNVSASKQNARPLPPVPRNTPVARPLPPTPPGEVPTTTHYKRQTDRANLHHQSSLQPVGHAAVSRNLIRQTKSSSCVQEGPERYDISSSPQSADRDYENLESKPCDRASPCAPSSLQHSSRDYVNLEDEDYDDTVSKDECVYEDYIPRPGAVASINSPQQAPISRPQGKGAGRSVGYVNVEMSADILDNYSILEAVHPQPTSLNGDYSRLDLSGNLDLGPPDQPPSFNGGQGGRPHNKDYVNLAHVAHPDTGDYSNLQY